jgi:small subunit ribosomal protein S21
MWRFKLAYVRVREGEDIEVTIKRFKKEVEKEDIINDIKSHQYYEKPSVRRRRKFAEARRRTLNKSNKQYK